MKNTFARVALAILLVAGYFTYKYFQTTEEPEVAQSSAVMYKLFELKTEHAFVVNVPETSARCELTDFVDTDRAHFAKGDYEQEAERGSVLLDYPHQLKLQLSNDDQSYWAIPFVVTNQGSGSFWYLGLFALDQDQKRIEHIDSHFIGDRIELDSLAESSNGHLQVNYRTFAADQNRSETPTEQAVTQISYRIEGFGE